MSRPNILLITTDEERLTLPTPTGFVLPSRERLAAKGVSFERYYVSSAMCSSSRSVIYTGQHVPVTEIYDNDNMPYIRPLDPSLGTLGNMLGSAGYHCVYQGKWHLSNAYRKPGDHGSTVDALQPYGFLSFTTGATSTAAPGRVSRSTPSSPVRPPSGSVRRPGRSWRTSPGS